MQQLVKPSSFVGYKRRKCVSEWLTQHILVRASDIIMVNTALIAREETHCRHFMGYSFWLAARDLVICTIPEPGCKKSKTYQCWVISRLESEIQFHSRRSTANRHGKQITWRNHMTCNVKYIKLVIILISDLFRKYLFIEESIQHIFINGYIGRKKMF